jgi:hypothetical protein
MALVAGSNVIVAINANPAEITVPFVQAMIVQTADVAANIWVWAKSLGPEACGVTFSTDLGKSIQFLAPPLVFSPWTILQPFTGALKTRITDSVACDTGFLGEVRYYK